MATLGPTSAAKPTTATPGRHTNRVDDKRLTAQTARQVAGRAMETMTIRKRSELAQALDKERRKRGTSLNRTVLALLRNASGVPDQAARSNGLRRLAGTWSEAEYKQFERAVAPLGEVDEAMWR